MPNGRIRRSAIAVRVSSAGYNRNSWLDFGGALQPDLRCHACLTKFYLLRFIFYPLEIDFRLWIIAFSTCAFTPGTLELPKRPTRSSISRRLALPA